MTNEAYCDPADSAEIVRDGRRFHVRLGAYRRYWQQFEAGRWDRVTMAVLNAFVGPQTLYVDLGGFIGQTVLYAAASGARVHAFEPDPVAFGVLESNLGLNAAFAGRVTLHACAAGVCDGDLTLYSRGFGFSETSALKLHERKGAVVVCEKDIAVPQIDFARFLRDLSPRSGPLFVKIDIEGGEYELCPAIAPCLAAHDATIFLSTHPFNLNAAAPAATAAWRADATEGLYAAFSAFDWFEMTGAGPHQLDKAAHVEALLAGPLSASDHILFRHPSARKE